MADARLNLNNLSRQEQLYNPNYVDRDVLRSRTEEVLKCKPQATLGVVIAVSSGITKGLTEVFGYLSVLKEYHRVVRPDNQQIVLIQKKAQLIFVVSKKNQKKDKRINKVSFFAIFAKRPLSLKNINTSNISK